MISYDFVVERCAEMDAGKFDITTHDSNIYFPNGRTITIVDGDAIRNFEMTYYSFRQLFQKYVQPFVVSEKDSYELATRKRMRGQSTAGFLWNNPKHIPVVMNDLVSENRKHSDFLFRCKNNTLRAFLSTRYAPISNTQLVLQTINGVGDYHHLANLKVDDNFIKLDIIVENRDVKNDSNYGIGYQVRNDEIGLSSLEIAGTFKRTTCDNSIQVQTPIRMYHTGDIYERLNSGLAKLPIQLQYVNQLFARLETSKTERFTDEDFQMLVENARKRDNLSTEFLEAFFKGTEGSQSLFGFVNGLTYAAHTVHGDNHLRQQYFEDMAADMLMHPRVR